MCLTSWTFQTPPVVQCHSQDLDTVNCDISLMIFPEHEFTASDSYLAWNKYSSPWKVSNQSVNGPHSIAETLTYCTNQLPNRTTSPESKHIGRVLVQGNIFPKSGDSRDFRMWLWFASRYICHVPCQKHNYLCGFYWLKLDFCCIWSMRF